MGSVLLCRSKRPVWSSSIRQPASRFKRLPLHCARIRDVGATGALKIGMLLHVPLDVLRGAEAA